MQEETGCDGLMIGRGVQGNPWVFREIEAYLENGSVLPRPDKKEMKEVILKHAGLQLECKGEYTGIREMRKHISWYTKGMPNSARLRNEINSIEDFSQLENCVERLFD
jgi:tRNA-dihydrouridine synthase